MKTQFYSLTATILLATLSHAASTVYVSTYYPPAVIAVDATTQALVAYLPLSAEPAGIVADPTRDLLYVSTITGTVYVVDTNTHLMLGFFSPPGLAGAIDVSADGTTMVGLGMTDVLVIDLPAGTIRHTVPALSGLYAQGFLDITPDSVSAWVTDPWMNQVHRIDLASGTIDATVPVGYVPMGIAVADNGSTVYVGNHGELSASLISTTTNTEFNRVGTTGYPYGLLAHSNGSCYVADGIYGLIGEHDGNVGTQTNLFPAGTDPWQLAEVNGDIAIVGFFFDFELQILDPINGIVDTIYLPGIPWGVAVK